ncbi:InterPro IPR002716 [hydrothermal vent metagenome]|uniref:InterPro IPR002716 n=1 Tax=hydrothermal vent metagenome TaxID=652676 RepID=A0A3B0XPC7_9ZZZZ
MIIADTNIVSYLLLPTSYTDPLERLYEIDSDWSAPVLWRSEFRNVLALYLRKNIISLDKAVQLQDTAESMIIQNEYEVSSSQVLALVEKNSCSSYDCEFVALAQYLDTKLVTQDKKILREFPSAAISIADFLSF